MGDDGDSLDDVNDVKQVLKQVGVGQQLVEELQDALYDQFTQYTKGELLADIQIECIWQLVEQLTVLVRQRKRQGQRERRVERKGHQGPRQRRKQGSQFWAVRSAALEGCNTDAEAA